MSILQGMFNLRYVSWATPVNALLACLGLIIGKILSQLLAFANQDIASTMPFCSVFSCAGKTVRRSMRTRSSSRRAMMAGC